MNVSVYSREAIETMIGTGAFPADTAVISFYDPAIKRIDKDYAHVNYSGVCSDVFYSELDDLDQEVLKGKGYTYDTYFPEADDIAAFIYKAYSRGLNIICQCEYGQSRSAGCAAAILEHFYDNGISIFANYDYYPNQVVYHKIFDALEKQKLYHDNQYYYAADAEVIRSHLAKMQLSSAILSAYQPEDGNSAVDAKYEIERCLSERGQLYHSAEEIISCFLNGKKSLYASFAVTEPRYMCDRYLWDPYAVYTHFRYGYEKIPVAIWFDRFRSKNERIQRKGQAAHTKVYRFWCRPISSLSFFGKLSWDEKRQMIDAVPLIITNIQP